MPGYVLYVDAWLLRLLTNFLFTFLLLWATAEVTRSRTTRIKLGLAALIGTVHYLLYLLATLSIIPYYGLLRFFPVIILVSLAMVWVAFAPIKRKRFLTVLAYFYGIGFGSAGAGVAGAYLFGTPQNPQQILGTIISMLAILVIGELGWGIVQRRIFQYVYQIPVEVSLNGESARLTALVDTGNKLRDPLTQKPVMIVEYKALRQLFGPQASQIIDKLESGDLNSVSSFTEIPSWAARFRVLPFSSIGKEKGLLIGFRPDNVRLLHEENSQFTDDVVIAIHRKQLDPEGDYQALIPPEVLQAAIEFPAEMQPLNKGGRSHAASSHSKI